MGNSIWVITRTINEYDQDGDYLMYAFTSKPTLEDLAKCFPNSDEYFLMHLLNGGGRRGVEDEWYHLSELLEGEPYCERPYPTLPI